MQHSHSAYPPAEGERRTIGGYYPQYRIAASLILRSLREDSLQWIRIADPQAGRVDDLQIGSQARINAFQVKWSQYQGLFTYRDLTQASGHAPALIAQMADGWQRLRAAYPGSHIVVHLVTNDIASPSPSQHMPIGDPPPTPRHFAAFIDQVWKPAKKALPNINWSIPQGWRPTWEDLQVISGLCVTDFEAFVQDCELEFGAHLQQKVTGHVEAISVLLAEALKSPESPTVLVGFALGDFLLPVTTYADPELGSLLIEKTAARHGTQRAIETARYFLSKVCVYALPSTRAKWRRGIARALQNIGIDLQYAGLIPTDLQPDQEEQSSSRSLKLRDASKLSIEEVQARVSSIVDLQELLHNQSDDSYFDWQPIVAHIVKKLSVEDIYILVALFEHTRYASPLLAILSERLSALGEIQGAWDLGEQALNASQAHGWLRYYDGGSRLAAFQALTHVNPIRTRPLVYDRLVRDLTGEFWYPQNFALELDEILPLLTDEVPIQAIWPVIEQYVHTLFEGCSLPTDSPELNEQPSHDSPSWAIADLLILHIDHPVYAVAQASKRTCTKLLLQRDLAVQSVVHECLEKTESQQEHILMVLDAVSLYDPSAVAPFRNIVLSLHQSPNYAIRRTAQIIGRRIGCEQTVPAPRPMPLPAIYQLSFLQRSPGRLIDPEAISAEEPLPGSDDPVNIIRAVVLSVGLIAEKARLPEVNMYHHTAQIMQQLAPLSSWSEDGEKQLRSTLGPAGLRLTFYRPRAVLARRAMFHIIAELIDAHALGPSELFQLDSVLRFYDAHMFLLEPIQRPASVLPIGGKNRLVGVNEAWLEQTTQTADSACCKTDDGLIVLAEETTLKWLEWGTPTEVRRSVVAQSRTFYDEVGEGWLVVASQVAWDAITSQLGTLKRMIHVERSFSDKGERLQSDMHAERILDR